MTLWWTHHGDKSRLEMLERQSARWWWWGSHRTHMWSD